MAASSMFVHPQALCESWIFLKTGFFALSSSTKPSQALR